MAGLKMCPVLTWRLDTVGERGWPLLARDFVTHFLLVSPCPKCLSHITITSCVPTFFCPSGSRAFAISMGKFCAKVAILSWKVSESLPDMSILRSMFQTIIGPDLLWGTRSPFCCSPPTNSYVWALGHTVRDFIMLFELAVLKRESLETMINRKN